MLQLTGVMESLLPAGSSLMSVLCAGFDGGFLQWPWGKGPSALQRPLPSPEYRIRHLGDQAAWKERESSGSASVQVKDAGVGRMLGCSPVV